MAKPGSFVSAVGAEAFDSWYAGPQEEMRQDELLRYFYLLRSEILKEGTVSTGTSVHIQYLDMTDLRPLMSNPPPGAGSFFIGDRLGGSGWEVALPDGTTTKYYVALPEAVKMEISHHFPDPPTTHKGQSLADTSVQALAQQYVGYLHELVENARQHFNP